MPSWSVTRTSGLRVVMGRLCTIVTSGGTPDTGDVKGQFMGRLGAGIPYHLPVSYVTIAVLRVPGGRAFVAEPNEVMRHARESTPSPLTPGETLTRPELAELVNEWVLDHKGRTVELTDNYIGKLERGLVRWPGDDYRDGLRAVLGVETDADLGFRRSRRPKTTVQRSPLTVSTSDTPIRTGQTLEVKRNVDRASVPAIIGRREIEQVRTAARVFRDSDARYGGGLVRAAVVAELEHSSLLLRSTVADQSRGALFSAVGELAQIAGFMALDACSDESMSFLKFAQGCAEEAADWHLRAKVLSSMARERIWFDDADNGLTLIELAMVRSDRLTATERAMLQTARARALAKLGRVKETLAAVDVADAEFSNSDPAIDPQWMHYYDAAQHAGDTGHALYDVAINGKFVTEAEKRLRAAVIGHADEFVRARKMSQTKLASLIMTKGDPREGANIGFAVLESIEQLHSTRELTNLEELHALAAPHVRLPEVAELRHNLEKIIP